MKKYLLTIVFSITLSYSIVAQKISTADVPSSVNDTFKAKFPVAKKISWGLDYDKYKSEFKIAKVEYSATFDKDGKWLKTETFLKPSKLPKVIKDNLTKEFGELSYYKIDDPEKIESAEGINYVMDITIGISTYKMIISEKGEILSKEEKHSN